MEKKNRKVICIPGDEFQAYEQVIFVMKEKNTGLNIRSKGRIDFVQEAEKIISAKLKEGNKAIQKAQKDAVLQRHEGIQQIIIKNGSNLDTLINLFVISACIILACTMLYVTG